MKCRQCEETLGGTGCIRTGVCGKDEELAKLQDILIGKLIDLSIVGCHKETVLESVDDVIVDSLFMTLSNTNFDKDAFRSSISEIDGILADAGCADGYTFSIDKLEKEGDIGSLKEILLYGIKGLAAYYHHARVLGGCDQTVTSFIRKGLVAIKDLDSADELVSMCLECGTIGVSCLALLDRCNTERYGNPEITTVSTRTRDSPGILITGHDLLDLEMLLEQTKGTGVDVYTHGEMLPAHAYPAFKKYDNLVGNYGGAWYKQKADFASFNGPIIATTNCVLKPTEDYAKRLFTTDITGIPGSTHICSDGGVKDFSPVIEMARGCEPPKGTDTPDLTVGFAHSQVLSIADKIIDAVKAGAIKRFVVMAGCDGREKGREYYTDFAKSLPEDTVILTAGCAKYRYNTLELGDIGGIPRVIDAGQCNDCYSLVVIANALAEVFGTDVNGLPLSFNIAWYEQKAVLVLLSLLSLNVKNIMLGPRLPEFITPGVLSILVDTFGIKPNSDVITDMEILGIEKK